MSSFPDSFIRGISKLKYIYTERDTVIAALFMPDSRTSLNRSDKGQETSINWEDNDTVLAFTHKLKNDQNPTTLAFPQGAVRLRTEIFDEINNKSATANTLMYERQELPNNPFHGNIVFRAGIPNHIVAMVATVLAFSAGNVLRK